jgi:hypothetical protein
MPLYKGTFNWYGEIHILQTKKDTMSEGVAYRQFVRVLGKKLGRFPSAIKAYFSGEKDNYKIEEVKR